MEDTTFAQHLGFNTWEDLLQLSECTAEEPDRRWYIVHTNTWYQWVVWSTDFNMYFHHQTRDEALSTMKWLFEKFHMDPSTWRAPEPYTVVASALLGTANLSWM